MVGFFGKRRFTDRIPDVTPVGLDSGNIPNILIVSYYPETSGISLVLMYSDKCFVKEKKN